MKIVTKKYLVAYISLSAFLGGTVNAYTELAFNPEALSLTPEIGSTVDKARLITLTDGTLVALWSDAAGMEDSAWSFDGITYAARDIFLRTSNDDGVTWSDPINISNTAMQTDSGIFYDRIGDGSGLGNFYGDSGKASIFASGNRIGIAWNDTFCGPGLHGPARYDGPAGQIEIPFRCLYIARLVNNAGTLNILQVDRITDAVRDVSNEVIRATGAGFALVWQEDPAGLQPGEAAGEGDGASGARVTPGTDIWYTWMTVSGFMDPLASWQTPVPVSDNYDYASDAVLDGGGSRPALGLAGSPTRAMVVYEEAKNNGQADPGKFVLYHEFPFANPGASQPGTIVSEPGENSRRARVVAQTIPGDVHGTRMVLLWRQGVGNQGAPADVMMRVGRIAPGVDPAVIPGVGFRAEDLWPAVNSLDAALSDPALNLSSAGLNDPSSLFPAQDAKAHRAVLDGDFIFTGYTKENDVSDPTELNRYLLRTSPDGGATWSDPVDVSSAASGGIDIIEPRLIRTPGTNPSGNPQDIRNPDVYVLAWGTLELPPGAIEPTASNLFVTRTTDRGLTYEPVQQLREAGAPPTLTDEAIQLRVTPDGRQIAAIWIRRDGTESEAVFNSAVEIERTADLVVAGSATAERVDVGAEFSVTFTVTNQGPDVATDLLLELQTAGAATVQSIVPESGICLLATLNCELDELASGASVSVVLRVMAAAEGVSSLTAAATARELEPEPQDNISTVDVTLDANADLAITLGSTARQTKVNRDVVLTMAIANLGPQTGSDIQVTLDLPESLVPANPLQDCGQSDTGLICSVSLLRVGERSIIAVTLTGVSSGSVNLIASVSADENDPQLANNTAALDLRIDSAKNGGGCSYAPGARIDPTLPLLLLVSVLLLNFRSNSRRRHLQQLP